MKFSYKKIILPLFFLGLLYATYEGHRYYKRCTYLPVRYPFISANGFRHIADHFFDHPERFRICLTGKSFDPASVKDGDIIFIKGNDYYLSKFFTNIHPQIKARYALLSHNSDASVPGTYAGYLDDDKLLVWFGCNTEMPNHKKMFSIPIGSMATLNKRIPSNSEELLGQVLIEIQNGKIQKTNLIYLNVYVKNNPVERSKVVAIFKDKKFCHKITPKPYVEYLRDMATYKFVISPHGAGLDCHRTWEALLLGCIPIVKKSCLDVLYEGLPVLIVDDWNQVTEDFLEQKYQEMSQQKYQLDRLYIDYWIRLIRQKIETLMNQKQIIREQSETKK